VVNGIETVVTNHLSRTSHSQAVSRRDPGMLREMNLVMEDISNKTMPPEETDMMIKRLEKRADSRQQRSYVAGEPMAEVLPEAVVLRVGLTFLAGADKPQVTRYEERDMAGGKPDQKDASWRVNTAGTLLSQVDISEDLAVVKSDQTAMIAKHANDRRREGVLPNRPPPRRDRRDISVQGGLGPEVVTIDSASVWIVNDLRAGDWDIECTLIEVDMSSLWHLIFNYRHLIARSGAEMSFERTRELLDTMIEDARRLCARSPILFRMSTRSKIIYSRNTRYGINDGRMFQTLTTSQGIREIISLSASYYNALDPTGSDDTTQKFIKPRFLQMIVLLLSLLNDSDLAQIKDFLEATYGLKAERAHLELLFLKVIPLMSINSQVFLKAMVPAFEDFPMNHAKDADQAHYWNVFIQRILQQGYLLPGSIPDLGRENLSWLVKWPDRGFKSTIVFNNLQYTGCRLRAINEIPPIEFHPEAKLTEVTVELINGSKFTVSPADLEMITCLHPGTYTLWEAMPGSRGHDLEIQESHLNGVFEDAVRSMNNIIQHVNRLLAGPTRTSSVSKLIKGKSKSTLTFLDDFRGSGRHTMNIALLNQDTLAIAYKNEGRKIPRRDALRNMANDVRLLNAVVRHIERHASELSGRIYGQEKHHLKEHLDSIKNQLALADEHRRRVGDGDLISDEPISKVIYPGSASTGDSGVWHDYKAWYTRSDRLLHIVSQQWTISGIIWLTEEVIEIRLYQHPSKFYATPLGKVEEGARDDEVQLNDTVMLVGQYMIVAERDDDCQHPGLGYIMTNYLKVTSTETQNRGRRGMNRLKTSEAQYENMFR